MSHTASKRDLRRFGVFEADLQSRELRRDGVPVRLQDHQFEMLAALLERPGEVVTREELSARIWKDGTFVDFEAGLNTAAKRLRDALGDTAENPRYVQTLPKRGYRFIAPVEGGERRGGGTGRRRLWIGAAVIALAVLAFLVWRSTAPVKITSLAVLPMANLSQHPDEEYLADGMTDAVIASLAQVRSLDKVISRTSVMQFKDTKTPAPEIARKLGVRGIVGGTVQRQGDRLRVTVQLIDAARDRHVWSRSYDRDLRDVLMLQNEIARAIAGEVQAVLGPTEKSRLEATRKVNPEAYKLYARGRRLCNSWTDDGMPKGAGLLKEAVAIDGEYAEAYAALAECLMWTATWGLEAPGTIWPRARKATDRALELDPMNAQALVVRGVIRMQADWYWSGADQDTRRAVEIAPSMAFARAERSRFLAAVGRTDEALREANRAEELEPGSSTTAAYAPWINAHSGRYEAAVTGWRKLVEMDPLAYFAQSQLVFALTRTGRLDEAERAYRNLRRVTPAGQERIGDFWVLEFELVRGMTTQAERTLEEWAKRRSVGYEDAYHLACLYSMFGRRDIAIDLVEGAFRERSAEIYMVRQEPALDPLRGDPRFKAIVEKMRFPSK